MRRKKSSNSDFKDKVVQGGVGVLVTIVVSGIAYGSWNFVTALPSKHEVAAVKELAHKEVLEVRDNVQVVGAKADYIMDERIASLVARIDQLDRKTNKTREEIEQLKWLREELERARRIQRGTK